MKIILTASKDATIYQAFANNNVGLDEIIEIGKVLDVDNENIVDDMFATASARTLLYFDLPTVTQVDPTASYFLNLKLANASDLNRNQQLIIYKVSQSWDEGSGVFYQNRKNVEDGVTWTKCNKLTSWSSAGGDFLTGSQTQSIFLSTYPLQDIRIDITNILQPIVSQSLQSTFYGLALQFPITDETDVTNKGYIKIFSTQTHTIHQPTLEILWDNQVFSTGSLQPVPSGLNIKIVPSNLKEIYTKGDVVRVNLVVRDEYPLRSFDSTLRYKNKYYLPSTSYYSIVDTQSNTTIIGFDKGSKINVDSAGSYIILDTTPLYSGRFYTIKMKINSGSYSKVFKTDTLFKVE